MLLDIIVIVIVAAFVIWGFLRGIVKSLISAVGTLISSVMAISLSEPLASGIYRNMLSVSLIEKIEDATKAAQQSGSGNIIDKIMDSLPDFINNSLFNFGISQKELSGAASKGPEALETLLSPIVISALTVVIAIVIFLVMTVVVKIVSRIVRKAVEDSGMDFINRFFGALVGLVEGFVIVILAAFLIRIVTPHLQKVPEIISDESISDSVIFKGVYDSEIMTKAVSLITVSPNVGTSDE